MLPCWSWKNTHVHVYGTQFQCLVQFLCHSDRITKCPWKDLEGDMYLSKMTIVPQVDESLIPLDPWKWTLSIGCFSPMGQFLNSCLVHWSQEHRFFLVSGYVHFSWMGQVLKCNIPNFGSTIYRHEPIDHDDYIDALFLGRRPHCIWTWWFVLYIGRKPIVDDVYVYICWLCWAWTLNHMIDEMFCVGHGPWSTWSMRCFVFSKRL